MKINSLKLRTIPSIRGRFNKDKKHKRFEPRYMDNLLRDMFESHPIFE